MSSFFGGSDDRVNPTKYKFNQECHSMSLQQQLTKLQCRLGQKRSKTIEVFKNTHFNRIIRKHVLETNGDANRKKYLLEQWIKSLEVMQIQQFNAIRPFVKQLSQNNSWQMICGFTGSVPDQSQYSRKLFDPKLQEVLVRTFETYQKLIPLNSNKFTKKLPEQLVKVLKSGLRPLIMDCTTIKLSNGRYKYAEKGYVSNESYPVPSARLHLLMDGVYGSIIKNCPTSGNKHESIIADPLLQETELMDPWLKEFYLNRKSQPIIIFDKGYWRVSRFKEFDLNDWDFCIPWKKKSSVKSQFEILNFPSDPNEPISMFVWPKNYEVCWRRIIGKSNSSKDLVRDVLTNNQALDPSDILFLQKNCWDIEELFKWLKQKTAIKQPLGTSYESFVTHCLLLVVLYLVLIYFLLLLEFFR